MVDLLQVKFVYKGDYLFHQGAVPDFAYIILYGTVLFLAVKTQTYQLGNEPETPAVEPEKKVDQSKMSKEQKKQHHIDQIKKEEDAKVNFQKR
jgi:AAA+ superfamily predicted ATPase